MFKTNKKILILFTLSALVIFLFSGCSSEQPGKTTGAAEPDKNKIIIQNFNFTPNTVTIKKGETLTWVNNDANAHLISSISFGSEELNITNDFSHTFKEEGTFEYTCSLHTGMTGKVIVK